MKSLAKKILPTGAMNALRDAQAAVSLVTTPKASLNAESLRAQSDVDLDALLRSDAEEIQIDNTDQTGGVNPGDRRAIYALIKNLKPQNVLEIGTHIGASTLNIAAALEGGKVTTVDIANVNAPDGPWKQLGLDKSPIEKAKDLELQDQINFIQSPALDFMQKTDETFDFIFLDGDHRAHAVYQEITAALKILNPGGVILLHDYYPEAKPLFPNNVVIAGPFRAGQRVQNESADIIIQPLGQLPWETKLGSRMTSLAMVLRR